MSDTEKAAQWTSMRFSSQRSASNTFSAIPLDRATERRDQSDWLTEIHQHAFEILVSAEHLIAGDGSQARLHVLLCADAPDLRVERWYLGHFEGAHYFARVGTKRITRRLNG